MKKSLTAFIAAAMTTAAMLTPMTTNAVYQEVDPLSDYATKMLKNYTEVENIHFFDALTWNGTEYMGFEKLYVNDDGKKFIGFKKLNACDLMFSFADGIDKETVEKAIIDEFLSGYEEASVWLSQDEVRETIYHFNIYGKGFPKFDTAKAVEIIDFLKEKGYITTGELIAHKYSLHEIDVTDISYYNPNYWEYSEDNKVSQTLNNEDRMKDFVESELEGYKLEEVDAGSDGYDQKFLALVPPEGATLADKLETAEKVYQKTGAVPYYLSPESTKEPVNAGSIDIFNAVKGDANLDGSTTIADSVAILQSIGNKDKYPLSAQGEFNGDISGNYDGITAADALAVQQLDSQRKL